MRKVKIFIIHDQIISDYDDDYTQRVLGEGISDWEETTDEDFEYIKSNMYLLANNTGKQYVLIEQVVDGVPVFIKSIKDEIKKAEDREAKRNRELERKRLEAKAKKEAKKAANAKQQLQRLLQQNPEFVNELVNSTTR